MSCRSHPWVGNIPWGREWQPIPVLLPGKSRGQRSLAGYSPWGRKESGTNEQLSTHTGLQPIRLLCPRDFPGKSTGVGSHFLLQGIFLTQGSNLALLHWQTDSLVSETPEKPKKNLWSSIKRLLLVTKNRYLKLMISVLFYV